MSNKQVQSDLWKVHPDQERRKTPGESLGNSHLSDESKVDQNTIESVADSCVQDNDPVDEQLQNENDQLLQKRIQNLITHDNTVDHSKLHISVDKGDVILQGVVQDSDERYKVELLVQGILGIKKIVNDLSVRVEKQA